MHVGSRIRPVDGVRANSGADGAAGGATVGCPELERDRVAVDAHDGRAARRDSPCAPTPGTTVGVDHTHL